RLEGDSPHGRCGCHQAAVYRKLLPELLASARRWGAVGATCHGQRRRAIPPGGGRRNCRKLIAAPEYCVIPFLLPPPKNPCPTRAKKAPKLDVADSPPVARPQRK